MCSPRCERPWSDFQISSHLPLLLSVGVAVHQECHELAALTALVVLCSVAYHRQHEASGAAACADGFCAKALFLYGLLQATHSPSKAVLCANAVFASCVAGVWLATWALRSDALYDRIHPWGLHVVPAVWILSTVCLQPPRPLLLRM